MKNEKFELLYNYSRQSFESELQRFKNIEDKASKFISLLSIAIVGYTAIIQAYAKLFFPPDNIISWACLIFIAFTYITLISAWSLLFRTLKLMEMPRLPLNDSMIEHFKEYDLPTVHYTLSITCKDSLNLARKSISDKSDLLMKAYRDITFSAWLISISLILLVTAACLSRGNDTMTNSTKNPQNQQQPQSKVQQHQPDFKVQAPKPELVFDHAIPKPKGSDQSLNE